MLSNSNNTLLKINFVLMGLISFSALSHAQNSSDLFLLQNNTADTSYQYKRYVGEQNNILALTTRKKNAFAFFFRWNMSLYQQILSPLLSADCSFQTTCSNFSKQAILQYGLFKGVFLSADRINRCVPGNHIETPAYKIQPETQLIQDLPEYYQINY